MALDFKTMSQEKKIFTCAAIGVAVLAFIALIISFFVYGSVKGMIEGEAKKAAAAIAAVFGGKSYDPGNPLGNLNWVLILTFIASLGIAAMNFLKAPKSKLIPEAVPTKFVVPCIVVLTYLFVWLALATSKESAGFLEGKGAALAVFAFIFLLGYTAIFGLLAFENKDNLMKALPNCLLALGGLLLIIVMIRCMAYPGVDEAATKALLKGKDSIPSPLGMIKFTMIVNSLCLIGYGCLNCLVAKDED